MKLVVVSNFYNHHQKPLSDAFFSKLGSSYTFIETCPISEKRLQMGWGREEKPFYVKNNYTSEASKKECQQLIDEADVVIWGDAPKRLFSYRLKKKKVTFKYNERIYKQGYNYWKMPWRILLHYFSYSRHKNLYLLCASAYASADYAKTGCFIGKSYKWGYFPALKQYDNIENLIQNKQKNSIVWVARFIDWKHPEIPVEIAKRLKADGYSFTLSMIGNGELTGQIEQMIAEYELGDCVQLLGSMPPEQVRSYMEKSEIFLFTSDKNEGWGAVANESMNSACAIVASHAIGSVPFLIKDGENGLIYLDGNIEDLYGKVKWLLDHPTERISLVKKAYATISDEWNAIVAADKFLSIARQMLQSGTASSYADGVCSEARILRDDYYSRKKK